MLRISLVGLIAVSCVGTVALGAGPTRAARSANSKPNVKEPQAQSQMRSRQEVLALIERVGRTPPDWYAETPLDYPKTLDLSWPEPAKGAWNNQKNVGQYIWDVINPNPGRWRSGVRVMHHLLTINREQPQTLQRIMVELGRMYHELHQDYSRAAFWYRQAGVGTGKTIDRSKNGAHLAECYWRLGNREMAIELLDKLPLTLESIKLRGDLGDTQKAVDLAVGAARRGGSVSALFLLAGDASRAAGNYEAAIQFYRKVLAVPVEGNRKDHIRRDHERATASIAAVQVTETLDLTRIQDGVYRATALGYEGEMEIEVRVSDGKIEGLRVSRHKEKQFYSSIEETPRKIVDRQSIKGIDATSGATITSEAIINATAAALADAMRK